jgi:ABC-2 type transport system permease protein
MTAVTTAPAVPAAPLRPKARGWYTFVNLLARDLRIIRRDFVSFAVRSIMQPALFVFVFTYVMPRIAAHGGSSPFQAGAGSTGQTFSTILVPGLVATAIVVQGLLAVTAPLMMELSYTREIEDRVLAPISAAALGVEKIVIGALQSLVAGVVVFPFVLFIHAAGQAPQLDWARWPLLVLVLALSAGFTSAFAMFLAMFIDPRKLSTIFAIIVVPMTMLGCVYYPWEELRVIPWLQWAVLINPLVYISEALRAVLTPNVPHLHTWILLLALGGGFLVTVTLAARAFVRRVIS